MTTVDIAHDHSEDAYRRWASEPIAERPVYSVIIPAYNEAERIVPTIGAVAAELCAMGQPWELIVSDDGSTDATRDIVRDLALANLRVLESPNGGKGSAVRRGMLAAEGEFILFADADQSTPVEQFSLLLDALDDGADVAVGSRTVRGGSVANKSVLRRLLSSVLRVIVRYGFGVTVSDTQCGFKLFTAEAARALFSRQLIDGFSFDMEVIYLASRLGYRVAEVPVEWMDAPGSTVDPVKDSARFLVDLARIRWWSSTGRYSTRSGWRPREPRRECS